MTDTWFAVDAEDVLSRFESDAKRGLSDAEVVARLRRYGANLLGERPGVGWQIILWRQLRSLVVALLAGAALLSLLFGDYLEAGAIVGVLLLNTLIGFVTELRAQRSMEALRRLVEVTAKVVREGELREIPARELVPGDLLALEAGDLVSADARVLEANNVAIDEASLTGESVPVEKSPAALTDPKTPLAERSNMLFRGTTAVRGSGRAVVVATGAQTELGQVAALMEEAGAEETPLQRRLEALARTLIWVCLGVGVVVVLAGVWTGKELFEMVETAVALAVAAIPEGRKELEGFPGSRVFPV